MIIIVTMIILTLILIRNLYSYSYPYSKFLFFLLLLLLLYILILNLTSIPLTKIISFVMTIEETVVTYNMKKNKEINLNTNKINIKV